jgi:hypothetical protein
MKINLLDPGLIEVGGHHHDWDTRIANFLIGLGHEVSVYAHARALPDALLGFESAVRIERLFVVDPYAILSELDPSCGDIQRQLFRTKMVLSDLKRVERADLWLWPTAFAYQLRGCAAVDTDVQISACLHTPPADDLALPFAETGVWWRMAAKSLRATGRRILTIGTIEADGLTSFQPFIGELEPIHVPMPIDGTPSRRAELKTIGFLGEHRDEQGRHLVGELIDCCLKAGFKVYTQTDRIVPAVLRHHSGLTLLGYDGDFPSKVERCDLIVAPYRWDKYNSGRGSGVIWHAIASGIPCVAPSGSTPGRALARIGSASAFSGLSVASVFDAILHAQKAYPVLTEAAFRGAQEYRQQNGIARFVDVMINGSQKATLAH